jgi:hypothetical protein
MTGLLKRGKGMERGTVWLRVKGGAGVVFGGVAEVDEGVGEGLLVAADPAADDVAQGDGVDAVPALAAVAGDDEEAGLFEDAEVLHDGEAGEPGESGDEVAGGLGAGGEAVEEASPGGVGKGFEDTVVALVAHM